jgi:hypothetical protein
MYCFADGMYEVPSLFSTRLVIVLDTEHRCGVAQMALCAVGVRPTSRGIKENLPRFRNHVVLAVCYVANHALCLRWLWEGNYYVEDPLWPVPAV